MCRREKCVYAYQFSMVENTMLFAVLNDLLYLPLIA